MSWTNLLKKLSSSIETVKSWPKETVVQLLSSSTQATIGTISKYVLDILEPAARSLVNTISLVSWPQYRKNGLINNIPISIISGGSEAITALKNATIWGVVWWIGHLYKHWVQDNIKTLTNWTTEWIPWIWKDVSQLINFCVAVPALIPHTLNKRIKNIDKPLDNLNEISSFQKSKIRLRA